ncbi:MAG: hypothetical protein V3V92_01650 [Candidatus Hydrothermarchaeales archaeon]
MENVGSAAVAADEKIEGDREGLGSELVDFGDGLVNRARTGSYIPVDRREREWNILRNPSVDRAKLDELEIHVQRMLKEKRDEFNRLTKKFGLSLGVPKNSRPEIQRILSLRGSALDKLESENQEKLEEKRTELRRLTLNGGQWNRNI